MPNCNPHPGFSLSCQSIFSLPSPPLTSQIAFFIFHFTLISSSSYMPLLDECLSYREQSSLRAFRIRCQSIHGMPKRRGLTITTLHYLHSPAIFVLHVLLQKFIKFSQILPEKQRRRRGDEASHYKEESRKVRFLPGRC